MFSPCYVRQTYFTAQTLVFRSLQIYLRLVNYCILAHISIWYGGDLKYINSQVGILLNEDMILSSGSVIMETEQGEGL